MFGISDLRNSGPESAGEADSSWNRPFYRRQSREISMQHAVFGYGESNGVVAIFGGLSLPRPAGSSQRPPPLAGFKGWSGLKKGKRRNLV